MTWLLLALAFALPPADLDLVRDTVTRDMRPKGRVSPLVARYRADGKALDFLAARHRDAPTIRWVEASFASLQPDMVVIEGVPREAGLSPLDLDATDEALVDELRSALQEPRWTALLATRAGVPYVGAEPTRAEALEAVLADGRFTQHDFLCMEMVRIVPQWAREGVTEDELADRVAERRAWLADDLGLRTREVPTWRQVERWYAEGNGEALTLAMPVDRVGLGSVDHAWKTKRLSHALGRVRNRRIAATIDEALRSHDRVLVVYGASHYESLMPFLDGLLGEPVEVAVRRELIYPSP